MDVRQQLEEAIQTGEILTVVYQGGSQPGTSRQISPIKIEGGKVRARCFSTNAVKLFNLDKVLIPDSNDSGSSDISLAKEALADLPSFKTAYLKQLEARGWTIEHGDDHLFLYDHYKNGKRLKSPALALSYQPEYTETVWRDDDFEEVVKQRDKPWCVSTRKNSTYFKHQDRALSKFLTLELDLSPFR